MSSPNKLAAVAVAVVMATGVAVYLLNSRPGVEPPGGTGATSSASAARDSHSAGLASDRSSAPGDTNRIVLIRPGQILAKVNGHELQMSDLFPVRKGAGDAEQRVPRETYEYALQRAVDRELVLQTARAQGLELTLGQKQQLAGYLGQRQPTAPGDLKVMNPDGDHGAFETKDVTALMLQTALMENAGVSPNVSDAQVQQYFQEHAAGFGELPQTEPARSEAWSRIDYEIRQRLAADVRASYQTRLTAYMDQLKSQASIVVSQLPDEPPGP